MNTLMTLKIIDAITTALTGLLAPVRQRASVGLTGQVAEVARGMFEIRAIIGKLFIAPGIAPFILVRPVSPAWRQNSEEQPCRFKRPISADWPSSLSP